MNDKTCTTNDLDVWIQWKWRFRLGFDDIYVIYDLKCQCPNIKIENDQIKNRENNHLITKANSKRN